MIFPPEIQHDTRLPFGQPVDSMRGNLNVRTTENGAVQRAGKSRRHPLKSAPFHGDLDLRLII